MHDSTHTRSNFDFGLPFQDTTSKLAGKMLLYINSETCVATEQNMLASVVSRKDISSSAQHGTTYFDRRPAQFAAFLRKLARP